MQLKSNGFLKSIFREYKKKIELAKAKMSAIQRKQKETEKIANFSAQNTKK